jgi:6-phosphogluconolactonase (cycloisomerase 2 family)
VARFLYVANAQSGTIAQYQIDATTGAITCLNVVFIAPGQQPSVIAVNPDQTLLFALTQTTISSFTIDAKAGGLTPIEATGPTLGAAPWWLAVDPSGTCLVETDSADDTVTSFTVGATGTLTQGTQVQLATGNGTANCAITTNAGTEYVAVCGQTLGTLNVLTLEPGTGALALLSGSEITTSATTEATIVQFDPTGVYGVVATQDIVNTPPTSSSIVAYTFAAGVLTQVGSPIALGAGAFPWDVEFDSKSANVFVVCDEPQGTASAPTAPNAGMVFNFTNAAGTLAPNATTPSTTVGYLPMQLALTDDTFGYTADAASSDIAVLADNAGALSSVGAPTPITTLSGGSPQVPLSLVTVR